MTRLFLPADAMSLALGAEQVLRVVLAEAKQRGAVLDVVRTGTRGAAWLEPLIEIETPAGRIACGSASLRRIRGSPPRRG